jgi:23S rRNA pseudouridine2605 synthase
MAPKAKPPAAESLETPGKGAEKGERIAKVLSRRGIASRREAERLIETGEVVVNGRVITSPALNVTDRDRITVSGQPLPDKEPARLWLYYKPEGLVTSAADEKGRDTVFDHLPDDMPRVMSIGRLDLNSEGLLLLTNDGELKRRLELPSTGWLRKYRVRVNGNPTDADLEPLRKGITVDGERFQPMQVTLDRIQGANAWLTVGLREGKNREIRRAMNAIDLYVNRLIRTSYGPFRLNDLQPGEVEEVRQKVLREQLGEATEPALKPARPAARKPGAKPAAKSAPAAKSPAAHKPATKPAAKPTPRRASAEDRITLPRNARPGDGVKALAAAWKEAVTPDAPRKAPAKPSPKPSPKPAGKGAGPTRSGTARPERPAPRGPRSSRGPGRGRGE